MNKFTYVRIIQGNYGYGYGWEDLSEYDNTREGRKQARKDIREYRLAEPYASHRLIARRIPNKEVTQ